MNITIKQLGDFEKKNAHTSKEIFKHQYIIVEQRLPKGSYKEIIKSWSVI